MQSKEVMNNLLRRGLQNKQKITKNKIGATIIKYEDMYRWIVYTDDNITQFGISNYLNAQGWDNRMENIIYKKKNYSCFPVISSELISWLKKNSSRLSYDIFHQKYNRYSPWLKLKPSTKVK